MKHRSVVSNFIFKWSNADKTDQLVALFKRSQHPDIHSYQGKYAPVSGSIEEDDSSPVAAAVRELREETQLVPYRDLELEFSGKPFSISDEKLQRSWTVHPLGWILSVDESKIKFDWEHSGWEWFDPQKVLDRTLNDRTVPDLDRSLQRVYFGPNGIFKSGSSLISRSNGAGAAFLGTIKSLRANTKDGARALAAEALKGLLHIAAAFLETEAGGKASSAYWHALRVVAYHLTYSARPSMNAAIHSNVSAALHDMSKQLKHSKLAPETACHLLQTRIQNHDTVSKQISEAFCDFAIRALYLAPISSTDSRGSHSPSEAARLTLNIITLSMSGTVFAALQALLVSESSANLTINLTILESRPQCEGASLAASLLTAAKGLQTSSSSSKNVRPILNIKIIPESHAILAIRATQNDSLSLVLLGADRVTPFGHVLNKTGSAMLALCAKSQGDTPQMKVVVLSEEDKIARADSSSLAAYSDCLEAAEKGLSMGEDISALSQKELHSQPGEDHDASEVYSIWSQDTLATLRPYIHEEKGCDGVTVRVQNNYFETVDRTCIDVYIGENGEVLQQGILRKSVERAKIEEELFQDLYD